MLRLACLVAFLATTKAEVWSEVSSKADLDTLVHVHVVWRHGDRTPSVLMPTDKANDIKTWPDGLGEITRKGLEQQFHLGSLIRTRYDGFLSKHYSPFEIYIRSSDYNRTLTSAQANLLGMYPPEDNKLIVARLFICFLDSELFVKNIRWRPIPVHTLPKQHDKELYDRAPCPNAETEEDILYNSPEILKIEEEHRDFLSLLGKESGYTKEGEPMRLRNVWQLFDPLWAEFNHPEEHKLPEWANETVREQLATLYHLSSSYLYGSPLLKRLRVGPLFGAVLGRMEDRVSGLLDQREKLYAYSAHDTAVSALLNGFGVNPVIFPEYATAAFVELHKNNDSHFVQLFYKNDTNRNAIYRVDIPFCADPCPLKQLRDKRQEILPSNWEEECGLYQIGFPHFYIYAVFTGSAFLLLLILSLLRVYRRRVDFSNPCLNRNYKLLEENAED